jgi:threonine 3-dehydrogenase
MNRSLALVTGAGGEMGRLLVPALVRRGVDVVALDLAALPPELEAQCAASARMNILDTAGVQQLMRSHQPGLVFHLAAMLSGHAERDPELAHRVNVDATLSLYALCRQATEPVRFLFPSSIAVYGLPDAATKTEQGPIKEWMWNTPTGIYGCNKVYCELVGNYLSRRSSDEVGDGFDFRAIRFPGLISAETLPSGGTTDFAPEMIHAAAKSEAYSCFVTEESRLPFMTMPDAIEALLTLAESDASKLSRRVYNIKGFSCSAGEILEQVRRHFPDAEVSFASVQAKQRIVDSWPADVDDSRARRDWGLTHRHGLAEAFDDYLIPALRQRYSGADQPESAERPLRFPQRP